MVERFKEYQEKTGETAIYKTAIAEYVNSLGIDDREKRMGLYDLLCMLYTSLGLAGEAGEILNKAKKVVRDKKGIIGAEFIEAMKGEIGDVLYYASELSQSVNLGLADVATENINKLASRKERGVLAGNGDNR